MSVLKADISPIPQEVVEYLDQLERDSHVVGIMLFGSWARGNHRPDSDVDLIVFSTSEVRRSIEQVGAINIELVITTESDVKEFWKSNKDDCADLWSYGKVLFDRDQTVERLRSFAQEIILAGKPPIPEWQVNHLRFDCTDTITAAQKLATTDPITARLLLHRKLFDLTELYFTLRQKWTPAPKQRIARILAEDQMLFHLFEEALLAREIGDLTLLVQEISHRIFDVGEALE